MQLSNPIRHHTPDDDPEPGTLGTGEDICPDCRGTGKQVDKAHGQAGRSALRTLRRDRDHHRRDWLDTNKIPRQNFVSRFRRDRCEAVFLFYEHKSPRSGQCCR